MPPLGDLHELLEETLNSSAQPQSTSTVEPHRDLVEKLRKEGVEIAATYERPKEQGYTDSYASVHRFVRHLEPRTPDVTVPVETRPGQKPQVVSEYGEPLTWRKTDLHEVGNSYALCRCGQSRDGPFCDGTHSTVEFDGTETAGTGLAADRRRLYPLGTHSAAKYDSHLCMKAGFCAIQVSSIKGLVPGTAGASIRSQVMAMI